MRDSELTAAPLHGSHDPTQRSRTRIKAFSRSAESRSGSLKGVRGHDGGETLGVTHCTLASALSPGSIGLLHRFHVPGEAEEVGSPLWGPVM